MAGLYIHIPFCRKACHYCNFHFSTTLIQLPALVDALIQEIGLQKHYLEGEEIETIYFGGGTPSVLSPEDIQAILNAIHLHHRVNRDAEITLEANPEDINTELLSHWKAAGINRLSIGVQGFQDQILSKWNRSHDSATGLAALKSSQSAGITNISSDLIYGDPLLSDEEWLDNIQQLTSIGIPHLSCYALTVETGTALHHQIASGKTRPIDEEQSLRQYSLLQKALAQVGYEQYEVSNFAKPGFHSKHNTSYWSGKSYLGIGPSAHSFNQVSRQWNVPNNALYIQSLQQQEVPFELEEITADKRYNEWVMTGLRTSNGIDPAAIIKLNGYFLPYLEKNIKKYIDRRQILIDLNGHYVLVPEQYFFADGIAADLFMVD